MMKFLNNTLLGIAAFSLFCYGVFHLQTYEWGSIWGYRQSFFYGWLTTIVVSFFALLFSSALGLVVALAKRSSLKVLRFLAQVYIEIIRGTPLLVQILFFFYVISHDIGLENRFCAGVVILSIFSSAFIAEIIRSGIESIPKSQLDSAKAIGLTSAQTYRFVIFPQAFRNILPPLTGQLAALIKDSSLLSLIGVNDVTYAAQQISSATYSTLEVYFPLAAAYLILTLPISLVSRALEKRFSYVH